MSLVKKEIMSKVQAVVEAISTDEKVLLVDETIASDQICVYVHSNPTDDEAYLVVKGKPVNYQLQLIFATSTFKTGEIRVVKLTKSFTFFQSHVVPNQNDISYDEVKVVKFRGIEKMLALVKALIIETIGTVYEQGDLNEKQVEIVRKEIAWELSREAQFHMEMKAEMDEQKAEKSREDKQKYEDAKNQYLSKVIDLSTYGQEKEEECFEYSWSKESLAKAQPSQPEKKKIMDTWLKTSKVMIEVNGDAEGIWLPPHLMGKTRVKLNLSHKFNTSVFEIHDTHISVDLSFGGVKFLSFIPLKSVFAISNSTELENSEYSFSDENHRTYPADTPNGRHSIKNETFSSLFEGRDLEKELSKLDDGLLDVLSQIALDFVNSEMAKNNPKEISFSKAKKQLDVSKEPKAPKTRRTSDKPTEKQ